MTTIDFPRDPCADQSQQPLALAPDVEIADPQETPVELHTWARGQDRAIKFIQHPAYRAAPPTALRAA